MRMSVWSGLGFGVDEEKWEPVLFKMLLFCSLQMFALIKILSYLFMCHKIHPFKAHSSVDFSIFRVVYYHPILEHFHHRQGNPLPIQRYSLFPAPPSPSPGLYGCACGDISYEWNHMICNLCRLSLLTSRLQGLTHVVLALCPFLMSK